MDAIRIQASRPVVDVTTNNAQMRITNSRPIVRIKSERPVMRAETQNPEFSIDPKTLRKQLLNGQAPETSLHAETLAKQTATKADAASVKQTPTEVASQTREQTAIPVPPEQASRATVSFGDTGDSPQVQWSDGHMAIEWSDFVMEIDWDGMGGPQIDVEPYSVEVSIRNQPIVRFKLNPKKIPDGVGVNVDKTI